MACMHGGVLLSAGHVLDTTDLSQCFPLSSISWKNQGSYGCPPSSSLNPSPVSASASSASFSSAVSAPGAACKPRKKRVQPRQLFSVATPFNEITVLDIPHDSSSDFSGSRLLLLDESGNIHSIYREDCKYTNAYWSPSILCRSSPQSCPSGSPQLKCSVNENASDGRKIVGLALQCWLLLCPSHIQ
ncbi:hypothetical protein L7F22_023372 [Adiantum nelumboides]|nr:hypothetical protein [Adiantum nelumboides]